MDKQQAGPGNAMYGKQRELFQRFKVQKFLGKGSYGSVYRVKRLDDGQVYAVKEADVQKMSVQERTDSVNEIRILASIRHPNVVRYHEAFVDGNWLCIIMEYAPNGDLHGFIKKGQELRKPFPEDIIWKFFIQILQGVQELHKNKILHRDIKPMNIFVCHHDVVKVGDLGIAKILKDGPARTQIGTPHYMPPEIWQGRAYGFACDMWSLGCLLYEMMTYRVPFEAQSMNELRVKVMAGQFPRIQSGGRGYSKELVEIQEALMSINPSARPSCDKILALPAVKARMHLLPTAERARPDGRVLSTIRVPRDLRQLRDRLPAPSYDDSHIGLPPLQDNRRSSVA